MVADPPADQQEAVQRDMEEGTSTMTARKEKLMYNNSLGGGEDEVLGGEVCPH